MSSDKEGNGVKPGGRELAFIVTCAAIFLAIAGCVVYVVCGIIV